MDTAGTLIFSNLATFVGPPSKRMIAVEFNGIRYLNIFIALFVKLG
jgi:hypothetical protein